MSEEFKLSNFVPTEILSAEGLWFVDNILGAAYDQYPEPSRVESSLAADATAGAITIELNDVFTDMKRGDRIFVSSTTESEVIQTYQASIEGGPLQTVKTKEWVPEDLEVRYVESVDGKTVTLDKPLTDAHKRNDWIYVYIHLQHIHKIVLEELTGSQELALKGAVGLSSYILTTYDVGSNTYEIPIDPTLFAEDPDPSSIRVEYIDPRWPAWISLTKGVDFSFVAGDPDKIQIINAATVNKPQELSSPVQFRALKITYKSIIPTTVEVNNSYLQGVLNKGEYFTEKEGLTVDNDAGTSSDVPGQSASLMAIADRIIEWSDVDKSNHSAILGHKAYMLGLHNGFDNLPVALNNLITEAKNIHSSVGTKGLSSKIGLMLGVNSLNVDNEYSLSAVPGVSKYEKFFENQKYLPTYNYVDGLFGFKDNSSSITKSNQAGWGNAGAYTTNLIDSTLNEVFTCIIGSTALARCGLNFGPTFAYGQDEIEYAIEIKASGNLDIYENASLIESDVGVYSPGDVLTFAILGGNLELYLNSAPLGTAYNPTVPAGSYSFASTIYDPGLSILDIIHIDQYGTATEASFAGQLGIDLGFSVLGKKLLPFLYVDFFAESGAGGYGESPFGLYGYGKGSGLGAAVWTDADVKRAYAYFSTGRSHNPLIDSEKFDTANWIKENTTVAPNVAQDPAGNQTADRITTDATHNQHRIRQNAIAVDTGDTFASVYVKADGIKTGDLTVIFASDSSASKIAYELETGTITGTYGTRYSDGGIIASGDGWFRVWMQFAPPVDADTLDFIINIGTGAEGDSLSSQYVWGAAMHLKELETYHTRVSDFNGIVFDTIEEVLQEEYTHRNHDIQALSSFAMSAYRNSEPLLDDPTSHLHDQMEHIKPFSRQLTGIFDIISNKFVPGDTTPGPVPHPDFRMKLDRDLVVQNGIPAVPTYTRTTTATYFDPADGLMKTAAIDAARFEKIVGDTGENKFVYSEDFFKANWAKDFVTIHPNAEIAPNGTLTCDLAVPTPGSAQHRVKQTTALTAGVPHTFSVYVKSAGYHVNLLTWKGADNGEAGFDLTTGAVIRTAGGSYTDSSITDMGSGWWRVSVTITPTQTDNFTSMIYISDLSGHRTLTADGIQGLYIWGAQTEDTAAPTDYIQTLSTVAVGHTAFLTEGESTNELLESNTLTTAPWSNSLTSITQDVTGPDGATSMWTLQDNSAVAFESLNQTITVPADTLTRTFSIWILKTTGGTAKTIAVNYDLTGGSGITSRPRIIPDTGVFTGSGTHRVLDRGDFWVLETQITNDGTNTSISLGVFPAVAPAGTFGDDATETGSNVFGFGQIEELPFVTSYIPTTTTPVTRTGDYLSFKAEGNDVSSSVADFTISADVSYIGITNNDRVFDSSDDGHYWLSVGSSGTPRLRAKAHQTTPANAGDVLSVDTLHSVAMRLASATQSVWYDGINGAANSVTPSGVDNITINIGSIGAPASHLYGHINNVRLWHHALTDAEMISINNL